MTRCPECHGTDWTLRRSVRFLGGDGSWSWWLTIVSAHVCRRCHPPGWRSDLYGYLHDRAYRREVHAWLAEGLRLLQGVKR